MQAADRLVIWIGIAFRTFKRRLVAAENRANLARLSGCGRGVRVNGPVRITGHDRITIGENVHIGEGAFIRGEGGLNIGDNTHISRNLLVYTMNHNYEGTRLPYDDTTVLKPVVIGKNVWIGMNVSITPGSRIGDGAIVGMGTLVSGDVPAMSIIGSQPWRILSWRNEERYSVLESSGAFGGPSGREYRIDS